MARGGVAIQTTAIDSIISGPATGNVYPSRANPSRDHQASAPGEAPAADTGDLHGAVTTVPISDVRFEVEANAAHAAPLELGTENMEPRPFMVPAFNQNREPIIREVRRAIRRGSRE